MLLVVAIERMSTMQLLCPGSNKGKPNSQSFPHMVSTDDAVNLTSEKHDPNAQMSHLQKEENKKDLVEGTGVVLAKYPPNVNLEILSQL